MLSIVRSGNWVTRERLFVYASLLLAGYAVAVIAMLATSHGPLDAWGRPLGSDFSSLWSAGQLVLKGVPEQAWSWPLLHAEQQQVFGDPAVPFYSWQYPPPFLLIAGLVGGLPYFPALLLWQGVTLGLYLLVVRRIVPERTTVLVALAFPAVLLNLLHGQNGFLTAALLGGGLCLLQSRPIVAGVLFGLLAYKPHFGLLLPLALVAGGHWRTVAAAAATVAGLVLITLLLFGDKSWLAFLDSMTLTRTALLEHSKVGYPKIQSVFSVVRMLGGPVGAAYAVQAAVSLFCAVAVIRLWRSGVDFALKAAALIAGSLLATPFLLDYDLTVLAPAIAFLVALGVRSGFRPYEKSVFAFAWLAPLATRPIAMAIPVSVAVAAMALLMAFILLRAAEDAGWRLRQALPSDPP